ncbi:MAG: archease [Phycisphaerae bacterium]|nr:archease [Phycisphaerae bacterium]
MAKSFELIDHAADIGIQARADTLAELLEALVEGLVEVICPRAAVSPHDTRSVAVQAEDAEATTVEFLNAVLRVIQAEHFMVAGVAVAQASATAVSAELAGEPYDPAKHEIEHEVKAATYHEVKVAREGGRWFGRVICDL